MKIVYSLIAKVHEVSGVQKVLCDIHNGIKGEFVAKVAGFRSYEVISKCMKVAREEYTQIKSIKELRNSVVITHERITSSKCFLLNKMFSLKIKHIHVQHSTYDSLKFLSFYPRNVVSISDRVTQNLTDYFKIPISCITKIHNGLVDVVGNEYQRRNIQGKIKIAYIARVDVLKNQIKIVNYLQGVLSDKIEIDFIGGGPLLKELKRITDNSHNFRALGQCDNVVSLLKDYDYVMLFSEKEGLPLTLIEGAMAYKPLLVNDIGGCLEIGIPSQNAFCANDLESLLEVLNSLNSISEKDYERLAYNSRKVYEQKFGYDKMINKYCKLIRGVEE